MLSGELQGGSDRSLLTVSSSRYRYFKEVVSAHRPDRGKQGSKRTLTNRVGVKAKEDSLHLVPRGSTDRMRTEHVRTREHARLLEHPKWIPKSFKKIIIRSSGDLHFARRTEAVSYTVIITSVYLHQKETSLVQVTPVNIST